MMAMLIHLIKTDCLHEPSAKPPGDVFSFSLLAARLAARR